MPHDETRKNSSMHELITSVVVMNIDYFYKPENTKCINSQIAIVFLEQLF